VGLGLCISKNLVEMYEGSLWLRTSSVAPNGYNDISFESGSVFMFTVKLCKPFSGSPRSGSSKFENDKEEN